jgi:hypothetical protein
VAGAAAFGLDEWTQPTRTTQRRDALPVPDQPSAVGIRQREQRGQGSTDVEDVDGADTVVSDVRGVQQPAVDVDPGKLVAARVVSHTLAQFEA